MHRRQFLVAGAALLLAACASTPDNPAPSSRPPATPVPPPAPDAPPSPPPKVRVALALGGGAAKGFAHVGVIKLLESHKIPVDIITGTSAGSFVGALYAAGYSGFQLQRIAQRLDDSELRDLTVSTEGFLKGEALQDWVNRMVKNRQIQDLPREFGAVATDLDSGRGVLFRRGNTGQAVRASCSIPNIFQPAPISGRRYVDGGLSEPVPVLAAREMGADLVIAVDISAKARHGGRAEGFLGLLDQSVTIMGEKLLAQQIRSADVIIRPNIAGVGAADFASRNRIILEGEKAAQKALPLIRRAMAAKQRELAARAAAGGAGR